jgi:hypothetical protein
MFFLNGEDGEVDHLGVGGGYRKEAGTLYRNRTFYVRRL